MRRKILYAAAVIGGVAVVAVAVLGYKGAPAEAALGNVVSSFRIPEEPGGWSGRFSQGLTYDGNYLLYLDDKQWLSTPEVFRITTAGSIDSSFDAPGTADGYYYHKGLAWDATKVWVSKAGVPVPPSYAVLRGEIWPELSANPIVTPNVYPFDIECVDMLIYEVDGVTGWVYAMNKTTGSVASSFPGPTSAEEKCFGLTSDGTYLYIGTYGRDDRVYKYTLGGSAVASSALSSCPHPMGLAYDGSYLWCVDDELEYIYKLEK